MSEPTSQTLEPTDGSLEQAALDRVEMNNLHTLGNVMAIRKDHKRADQNLMEAKLRNGRASTEESMSDDDTVNWRTQTHNHNYPPAQPQQQESTLKKLAAPALIAGGLATGGGLTGAAILGSKLIDKIGEQPAATQTIDPVENTLDIRFTGGQSVAAPGAK